MAPRPLIDRSVVRYAAVGLANTALGLLVIYAAMLVGLGLVIANVVGYGVGLLVSFLLNKRWTFGHEGGGLAAFLRFLLVVGVAYLANLATVVVAADGLGLNAYLAQAAGVVPYTVVGYLGSRFFAFRR